MSLKWLLLLKKEETILKENILEKKYFAWKDRCYLQEGFFVLSIAYQVQLLM